MLEWSVTVKTSDGLKSITGKTELSAGVVSILCEPPEGILQSVSAVVELFTQSDEEIFMNGYQTWTNCPEFKKDARMQGLAGIPDSLAKKYGFDRYGDYHFVEYSNEVGKSHGFSWCYFRKKTTFRLFASTDERPGYTIFSYDAGNNTLMMERDCCGMHHPGGLFHAFDLYYAIGSEDEVFDGWFTALGLLDKPKALPLKGYSSWYNRYENISMESILADLDGCKTIFEPGDLFQIDDGWEPAVGDWIETDKKKFPRGLAPIVKQIHKAQYIAGLWLAPFVCCKDSALMKNHPDWLLQVNGEPWLCGNNWGGFYALDIDNPNVIDYLRQVFNLVLNEWGFDLVKLDFLYGAAPFGNERESRAGRMIRAMDFLRALCGNKFILGCGVPLMPAFGRVDYCRIGCDISLDWDDKPYMRRFHRERVSTKQAIENTLFRRQLCGRAFVNDPDVFFLREGNIDLTPDQKSLLARIDALMGDVFLTSDDPSTYDKDQQKEYHELVHLFKNAKDVRFDADAFRIDYTVDGAKQSFFVPEDWFFAGC